MEKKTLSNKSQEHSFSKSKEIKKSKQENPLTEIQSSAKKAKQKQSKDEIYNIEALVEKKGSRFLVKWENFPTDQNTWEPRAAIPSFILKVNDTTILLQ